MIYYGCPKCGAAMGSPESMAGENETCPACGNVAIVPQKQTLANPPSSQAVELSPQADTRRKVIEVRSFENETQMNDWLLIYASQIRVISTATARKKWSFWTGFMTNEMTYTVTYEVAR